MKKRIRIVLVLLLVAGIAAGGWFYLGRRSGGGDGLRLAGNIEVTDAALAFRIAGQVIERKVSEGESVASGQVVARLESTELAAQVALRQAEQRAAEAKLAELLAGSRPEEIGAAQSAVDQAQARLDELVAGSRPQQIAAAQAALDRAQAEAHRFKVEYDRVSQLKAQGRATDTEFETAKSNHEAAVARVAEARENHALVKAGPRDEQIAGARAALAQAKQSLKLIKDGPRQEEIEQARAGVAAAVQAVELARIQLGYATLTSPMAGVVLSENVEPGEYVSPGTPVVTVGDLANVFLRVYVSETDLGRVKLGQQVRVTTDTFPGRTYTGRVTFISDQAEFTPKSVQTEQERVKLVYRVKVTVPNEKRELKPGMPADAEILAGEAE